DEALPRRAAHLARAAAPLAVVLDHGAVRQVLAAVLHERDLAAGVPDEAPVRDVALELPGCGSLLRGGRAAADLAQLLVERAARAGGLRDVPVPVDALLAGAVDLHGPLRADAVQRELPGGQADDGADGGLGDRRVLVVAEHR